MENECLKNILIFLPCQTLVLIFYPYIIILLSNKSLDTPTQHNEVIQECSLISTHGVTIVAHRFQSINISSLGIGPNSQGHNNDRSFITRLWQCTIIRYRIRGYQYNNNPYTIAIPRGFILMIPAENNRVESTRYDMLLISPIANIIAHPQFFLINFRTRCVCLFGKFGDGFEHFGIVHSIQITLGQLSDHAQCRLETLKAIRPIVNTDH